MRSALEPRKAVTAVRGLDGRRHCYIDKALLAQTTAIRFEQQLKEAGCDPVLIGTVLEAVGPYLADGRKVMEPTAEN